MRFEKVGYAFAIEETLGLSHDLHQIEPVAFVEAHRMKVGNLAVTVDQSHLVVPRPFRVGLFGLFLHRYVGIADRRDRFHQIEGAAIHRFEHAAAAHEIAVVGIAMGIERAPEFMAFFEYDDVSAGHGTIPDQQHRARK
jgi:hypothetical protein